MHVVVVVVFLRTMVNRTDVPSVIVVIDLIIMYMYLCVVHTHSYIHQCDIKDTLALSDWFIEGKSCFYVVVHV